MHTTGTCGPNPSGGTPGTAFASVSTQDHGMMNPGRSSPFARQSRRHAASVCIRRRGDAGDHVCLHDAEGYFVGIISVSGARRLSREHYARREECQQAIRERKWTRLRPSPAMA